jgi:hypothetical protein
MKNLDGMFLITREELEELIRAEQKLDALEGMGVDNWEGYGDALDFDIDEAVKEVMDSIV